MSLTRLMDIDWIIWDATPTFWGQPGFQDGGLYEHIAP